MQMRALLLIGLATLAIGGHARGADLRPPPPPTYAPITGPYNWSGWYLGFNLGGASTQVDLTAAGGGFAGASSDRFTGFIGGGQMGANYQIGSFVLGAEADIDASTQSNTIATGLLAGGTEQVPFFGTLRGRAGVAFDRWLVYATGGGAAVEFRSNLTVAGNSAATTAFHGGWTAGGGIEYAFTDYFTARVEYLHIDTGNNNAVASIGAAPPPTVITGRFQEDLVRVGLNVLLPAWR
jgi:outer membrane immunogenic protein